MSALGHKATVSEDTRKLVEEPDILYRLTVVLELLREHLDGRTNRNNDPLFETYGGTLAAGATATIRATREPQRWHIYMVSAAAPNGVWVQAGESVIIGGGTAIFVAHDRVLKLPGRSEAVTLRAPAENTAAVIFVAVASTGVEFGL